MKQKTGKEKYANQTISKYMQKIYSYAVRHTGSLNDAEDVSQEILLKIYRAVCVKDIENMDAFVWRIAKNTLINFYRDKSSTQVVTLENVNPIELQDATNILEDLVHKEVVDKLQKEIAYLSKRQREILIAYYYDNKKQSEIAKELVIPVGTVKWYLSNIKNDLKKGMNKMRNINELKFNPIAFSSVNLCGDICKGHEAIDMMNTALAQNIIYLTYHKDMSINEIAEALNVSPVYVESEIERLEENSIIVKVGKKYGANILVNEAWDELMEKMYSLFDLVTENLASSIFDGIKNSGLLDKYKEEYTVPDADENFLMWTLVFLAMDASILENINHEINSGVNSNSRITFEEVATERSDGRTNILSAVVDNESMRKHIKKMEMNGFNGPIWNGMNGIYVWLIDLPYLNKKIKSEWFIGLERDMKLLQRHHNGEKLHKDDYAYLIAKNYMKKNGDCIELAMATLKDGKLIEEIMSLADKCTAEAMLEYDREIKEYKDMILSRDPDRVKKQRMYLQQKMFRADGMFMNMAHKKLMENGRLKPLSDEQKKSAAMVMIYR